MAQFIAELKKITYLSRSWSSTGKTSGRFLGALFTSSGGVFRTGVLTDTTTINRLIKSGMVQMIIAGTGAPAVITDSTPPELTRLNNELSLDEQKLQEDEAKIANIDSKINKLKPKTSKASVASTKA